MGYSSRTCALSLLGIDYEPVKVFLLIDNADRGYGGICSHWSPIFLPLNGTYNTYGSADGMEEDWNYKFVLDQVKKNFEYNQYYVRPGSYNYDRIGKDGITNLEQFLDVVKEGGIYTRDYSRMVGFSKGWRALDFMFVRKDVYDKAIGVLNGHNEGWGWDETNTKKSEQDITKFIKNKSRKPSLL